MSTEVTESTLDGGTEVVKVMSFIFTDVTNTDVAKRKSKFRLKLINGIMSSKGVYREAIPNVDKSPVLVLEEENTQIMMQDEITVSSGKTLTGADVAECLGIVYDRAKKGDYTVEEEEIE
jgi:hypothetical protein